jgi:hypothetical protein
MANTGIDLITAIAGNTTLRGLDNCPGVPVQMGHAVYASAQNDKGNDQIRHSSTERDIIRMIAFSGSPSDTAVWHFSSDSPVHHFVVMPWYRHTAPVGVAYTVFMAYEKKYDFGQYVTGTGGIAPTGVHGYKTAWTLDELKTMLRDLVTSNTAWQDYFGRVGPARTMSLNCYKYNTLRISTAIANVKRYNRIK